MSFTSRNHPQQTTKRAAPGQRPLLDTPDTRTDDVDDRRTPPDLLAECARLAGVETFTLDVAASDANTVAPDWWTLDDDGTTQPWIGHVWCNPPYSAIKPWLRKAHQEAELGSCDSITMLLPANRTEQDWWQTYVEPHRHDGTITTYFLRGRRRFNQPNVTTPAKGDRPPFGLVVLAWTRSAR